MRIIPVWLCLLLLWAFPTAADPIRIAGTGSALAAFGHLAERFRQTHPKTQFEILPSLGSKGGIRALLAGRADIAISVSPISHDFAQSPILSTPWARSPFAICVSSKNPQPDLGRDHLLAIYSGSRTHWPDGTPIRPILRPADDSSSKLLRTMAPGMDAAVSKADQMWGGAAMITDQEAATALENVPGAIGPLVLGQVLAEKRQIRPLALDGLRPDTTHLQAGLYPFAVHYTLVTRSSRSDELAAFVAFVLSRDGRDAVLGLGFIP